LSSRRGDIVDCNMAGNILRLKPLEFAHILDLNSNVTCVENGPKSLILQENQKVVHGPASFIIIPPGYYCTIVSPAKLPVPSGEQAQLKFGQYEMRFHQEPFPLYPGEELVGVRGTEFKDALKKLPVIPTGQALKLRALVDFDDKGVQRLAGEEWQIEGPRSYHPQSECKQVDMIIPVVINFNKALRLKAKQDLVDRNGCNRVTGEEWLEKKPGSYLPGVYELVIKIEDGYTLSLNVALHLKAADVNLIDGLGKKRLAGEEWLVTADDSPHYIPEVGEKVHSIIKRSVLRKQQFCIVLDPVGKDGRPQFGKKELRVGPDSFFLKPGERLEDGVQNAYLLQNDEALILSAIDAFEDISLGEPKKRLPGDIWMICGPQVYIPPVTVKVNLKRSPIPLGKNEGVYVQNKKTGKVRTVIGPLSYLLNEHEALWEKEITPICEKMLLHGGCYGEGDIRKMAFFESSVDLPPGGKRVKTQIIKYRVPPNSAVQVYDHERQSARVVFGPNLVILEPAEEFNILNLSAGKPKKKDALKSLAIMLGPDYITDIIEIETLDHARLRIKYAANNKFEFVLGDNESERKLFAVPDYIGFVTKNIASRIRGRVARTSFDEFHRYSTRIVKEAVFGVKDDVVGTTLKFSENNMIITNIDVQSIEPVDTRMRDSLLKSVQLAIEISTHSIERAASHEASSNEQKAKGKLEKNKLANEKAAEVARRHLYELKAVTAAVESSGQAIAEAKAQAEKSLIESHSAIEAATLKSKAVEIDEKTKLESLEKERMAELSYTRIINELEVAKARQLAEIELAKSSNLINCIGSDTIETIAHAGAIAKMGLLQGLGIRSTLITDGKTPINLYQAPGGAIHPI